MNNYLLKLQTAISACGSIEWNPSGHESPWYEVWDLVAHELVGNSAHTTVCPQLSLSGMQVIEVDNTEANLEDDAEAMEEDEEEDLYVDPDDDDDVGDDAIEAEATTHRADNGEGVYGEGDGKDTDHPCANAINNDESEIESGSDNSPASPISYIMTEKLSRIPDFRILRYTLHDKTPAVRRRTCVMIIEVKSACSKPANGNHLGSRDFRDVFEQNRIQAKLAFRAYPDLQKLVGLIALGNHWRWIKWRRQDCSSPVVTKNHDPDYDPEAERRQKEKAEARMETMTPTFKLLEADSDAALHEIMTTLSDWYGEVL